MSVRGRHVVTVAAALVTVLVSGEAAPAPHSSPSLLEQVNTARRELGIAPLRFDPAARRVAMRMARNDYTDRPPEVLEVQPDCAVCDVYLEGGLSRDPRTLYRTLGGRLQVRFALWRAGWSAADNLAVFFPAAALVLDPRARTFAAARTPLGMLVVAVGADTAAPFPKAVRWPAGHINPRRQLWATVVLPPGYGYPNLYETRAGREVTVAYPLAVDRGFGRSRLVAFGLNTRLAFARSYRVGVARAAVLLKTMQAPTGFRHRSWQFTSMSSEDREAFLEIVGSTPPLLRGLLAELDGAVEIIGQGAGCSVADACEEAVGDRATVGVTRVSDAFVVLHELGHVVFDLALDERARRIFGAEFIRAGWDRACCINPSEVFADQLAFWALGAVPAGVRSYSDRSYLPRAEFARLLRGHAAYRPLSVLGRLAR